LSCWREDFRLINLERELKQGPLSSYVARGVVDIKCTADKDKYMIHNLSKVVPISTSPQQLQSLNGRANLFRQPPSLRRESEPGDKRQNRPEIYLHDSRIYIIHAASVSTFPVLFLETPCLLHQYEDLLPEQQC